MLEFRNVSGVQENISWMILQSSKYAYELGWNLGRWKHELELLSQFRMNKRKSLLWLPADHEVPIVLIFLGWPLGLIHKWKLSYVVIPVQTWASLICMPQQALRLWCNLSRVHNLWPKSKRGMNYVELSLKATVTSEIWLLFQSMYWLLCHQAVHVWLCMLPRCLGQLFTPLALAPKARSTWVSISYTSLTQNQTELTPWNSLSPTRWNSNYPYFTIAFS